MENIEEQKKTEQNRWTEQILKRIQYSSLTFKTEWIPHITGL